MYTSTVAIIRIEHPRARDAITGTMPNFPKFNKTIAHIIFTNTRHTQVRKKKNMTIHIFI